MRTLLLIALYLIGHSAALADGKSTVPAMNFHLVPEWCDVVDVTKDNKIVASLRFGEAYTFNNAASGYFGYSCQQKGHGGSATLCENSTYVHIIFTRNYEGERQRKINIICIN